MTTDLFSGHVEYQGSTLAVVSPRWLPDFVSGLAALVGDETVIGVDGSIEDSEGAVRILTSRRLIHCRVLQLLDQFQNLTVEVDATVVGVRELASIHVHYQVQSREREDRSELVYTRLDLKLDTTTGDEALQGFHLAGRNDGGHVDDAYIAEVCAKASRLLSPCAVTDSQ